MRRETPVLLLLFLLAGASPAAASRGIQVVPIKDPSGTQVGLYQSSYALVIGVADYSNGWPRLPSVIGETEQIAASLEAQGFQVTRVLDPDDDALEEAFENFIDRHGYDRDNRLLFYFSGHGYSRKRGEKGYLVASNAPDPRRDERGFLRTALPMSQLLAWSRQMEAKHALFLFDSCFSGTIFKSKALPATPPHIDAYTARPVRQYISAGDAGETVPAKSVFAKSFVRGLRGEADLTGDGYVTGTELGMYLSEKVLYYRTGQTPQYGKIRDPDLDEGDFVFRVPTAAAPPQVAMAPKPPPAPLRTEPGEGRYRVTASTLRMRVEPSDTARVVGALTRGAQVEELRRATVGGTPWSEVRPLRGGAKAWVARRYLEPVSQTPPSAHRIPYTDPVTGMEFVWLEGGCYPMGQTAAERQMLEAKWGKERVEASHSDETLHEVCVDGFYMATTEVTVGQFRHFAASGYKTQAEKDGWSWRYIDKKWQKRNDLSWRNPGFEQDQGHPVVDISWDDAQAFARWLSRETGKTLRLPSEAEWEYAARAGSTNSRFWGDDRDAACRYANVHDRTSKRTNSFTWTPHDCDDGYAQTAPVGTFQANGYGLHDMLGNVWEWVEDWYGEDYYAESPQENPRGPATGSLRVIRGGGWYGSPFRVRSAERYRYYPGGRYDDLGFRLVLSQ